MLFLHQAFYYISTPFPSCPRKKRSEKPTEIFSSALVCLKEFSFVEFSQNISKLFPPAKGPENCWALAAVHQSTYAGKFEHVFKCFAGSRAELSAFCCTKDNKVPSPAEEHWEFTFGASTWEQWKELDFNQMILQHMKKICEYKTVQGVFPETRKGFSWKLMTKKTFLSFAPLSAALQVFMTEHSTKVWAVLDKIGAATYWHF